MLEEHYQGSAFRECLTTDNDVYCQTNKFITRNEKVIEYIERYYKKTSSFLVMFNPSNIPVFEDRVMVYAEQIQFAKNLDMDIKFKKDKRHPDLYVVHIDPKGEVNTTC